MRKISIVIIILTSIFYTGCKKTHCPAFPAELNYFPYDKGQIIKFENSQKEIQSFEISYKDNSKSYNFDWNCKCACEVYSSFRTNENHLECGIYLEDIFNNMVSLVELHCNFYGGTFSKELLMGQKVPYNELYRYLSDTISVETEHGHTWMVFVKDKGLVSYTTVDGEEWKLVE